MPGIAETNFRAASGVGELSTQWVPRTHSPPGSRFSAPSGSPPFIARSAWTEQPTPQKSRRRIDGSSRTSSRTSSEGQSDGLTRRPRSTSEGERQSTGFGAPNDESPSEPATITASTLPASSQAVATDVVTPVHCAPSIPTPRASAIVWWTPKCASERSQSSY